ncbi:hypothetical protein [Oceanobacillus massiliensis]|uniref:hypothetical protein n=1 Tax=Oceanobacillus massiliensis TaxID=1465765 RepID=UPI00028970D7|nr:hypothetical protein [Oceanobacillus massiliensis]
MKESGIYQLKDTVIYSLQNLSSESHANTWAHLRRYGLSGMFKHSSNGGTAEAKPFRPYNIG